MLRSAAPGLITTICLAFLSPVPEPSARLQSASNVTANLLASLLNYLAETSEIDRLPVKYHISVYFRVHITPEEAGVWHMNEPTCARECRNQLGNGVFRGLWEPCVRNADWTDKRLPRIMLTLFHSWKLTSLLASLRECTLAQWCSSVLCLSHSLVCLCTC